MQARIKWLPISMAIGLFACKGQDMAGLQAFVEEVKSRPPTGISPVLMPKAVESALYLAEGRRSPFAPLDTGIRPDAGRPKEVLENYPIESLRMVGSLAQNGMIWGLVQSSDGAIHRVTKGNHLGLNHGRIMAINENKISLLELIQRDNQFQEQTMALNLDETKPSGKANAE